MRADFSSRIWRLTIPNYSLSEFKRLPEGDQAGHLNHILEHGIPNLSPSELIYYYVERSKIILTVIAERLNVDVYVEDEEEEDDDTAEED